MNEMDEVLKYCSVRIVRDSERHEPIGSGVLIRQEGLGEKIYMITAAHCLRDETKAQLPSIRVDIYNPKKRIYEQIHVADLRDNCAVSQDEKKDVAIVVLQAKDVLVISPDLPTVTIVAERANCKQFKCAGFPLANKNEYDQTNAVWDHADVTTNQFYLHLENDYIADTVKGYSGGGIFCETGTELLLYGIMKEYRKEEFGKVLYGEDLSYVNELLYASHLREIYVSYIVVKGLSEKAVYDYLEEVYDALGDRFIRDFNEPAPVEKIIEATCRTPRYYNRIEMTIDRWLNNQHLYGKNETEILKDYSQLRTEIFQYAIGLRHNPTAVIDYSLFTERASYLINELDKVYDVIKDNDIKSRYSNIRDYCYQLLEDVESMHISAANNRFLIIEGEAGCGKSHLFGHVSQNMRKEGCPALLCLGEHFATQLNISDNILQMAKLSCSFEDLMIGLNNVGKRMGRRIPILIDALNETSDMTYWRSRLPSFVRVVERYPYVVLFVSVRDTYLKRVITSTCLKTWEGNIFVHEGLQGTGYQAIKDFCAYYGLVPMSIPVLTPEFTNPLYLHMACTIAKESGKNELPIGSDIHTLFDAYIQVLEDKLEIQRVEYSDRHVVSKAVRLIAGHMYAVRSGNIWVDDCQQILDDAMPKHSNLLTDLLGSSLLAKEYDHTGKEYIRFTYQRMSDYYIANMLLERCANVEELKEQLRRNIETLTKAFVFSGVVEQLFIMIPERYDVEIWDVMDTSKIQNRVWLLLRSLHWRSAKRIHAEAIISFIEENGCLPEQWWNTILFLAPIPNHPFNGDYWTMLMKQASSMAERDAILQNYILSATRWKRYDNSIHNLISWAWTKGVSKEAKDEVARLVGMTLTWVLSSTIHQLRDQTTKALVNLLQHKPQTLLKVLQDFSDVDDAYIQERLLAVAYGCVLRVDSHEAVREIGRWVYDHVFASGNPPRHLLIRDYACNIVDYAYRQCGLEEVNMQLVLPPYGASMPQCPTVEEVDQYLVDYNDPSEKYAREQNAILYSVYKGIADFGHKRVEPDIQYFEPWNFRIESEYKEFLKHIRGYRRELLKTYEEVYKTIHLHDQDVWGARLDENTLQQLKSIAASLEDKIRICWSETYETILNVYIPNHLKVGSSRYSNNRGALPYQYWIVQRVFELGYDRHMHGWYDATIQNIEDRHLHDQYSKGRMERIGKKYEWIAYWELMGCLADNFMVEHPWDGGKKIMYNGAWLRFWRDCDPVCITRREEDHEIATWQEYPLRNDWDLPWQDWLTTQWTIEDVRQILWRYDESGNRWFTMHDYATIHGPKELKGNVYRYDRFYNYHILAYFIRKKDKMKFVEMAGRENFLNHRIVQPLDSHTYYFVREKYWSRACKMDEAETKRLWDEFYQGSKVKVMMPYVGMSGDPEDDKSGTRASYYMPIRKVFEEMHLQYADTDGDLLLNKEVCATSNPNRSNHFLMNSEVLMRYLEENDLDIIWVVISERFRSIDDFSFQGSKLYYHSGLYYMDENGELKGAMNVWQRGDH